MDIQNTLKTLQEKRIAAEMELKSIESSILALEKSYFQDIAREVSGWKGIKELKLTKPDVKKSDSKKKS